MVAAEGLVVRLAGDQALVALIAAAVVLFTAGVLVVSSWKR